MNVQSHGIREIIPSPQTGFAITRAEATAPHPDPADQAVLLTPEHPLYVAGSEFADRAARVTSRRRKSGDTAMQKAAGYRSFGDCAAKRVMWDRIATFFFGIRARTNKSPGSSEQSSKSRFISAIDPCNGLYGSTISR
jgi:hypothetical protein